MSLKQATIIEENLIELFKATMTLLTEATDIYFNITRKGSVRKSEIEKLKKHRDTINRIMENW